MSKVLIIGAGGVGTVVAHKVAQNPDVFSEVMIASRTKSKCDAVVKAIGNPAIRTAKVDAENGEETGPNYKLRCCLFKYCVDVINSTMNEELNHTTNKCVFLIKTFLRSVSL